jgi:hypothetical protein
MLTTVINAWNSGKDYVYHDDKMYGMFHDGIWLMHGKDADMESDKRHWIMLPDTVWGCNS